jgi:hypothetical protein
MLPLYLYSETIYSYLKKNNHIYVVFKDSYF